MKFTQKSIKALEPRNKKYSVSDSGLLLIVQPSGTKSFAVEIKRKKHTIGRWPEVSLEEAKAAVVHIKEAANNSSHTLGDTKFSEFIEGDYYELHAKLRARPKQSMERIRATYIRKYPRIADRKLSEITARDIDILKVQMLESGKAASTVKRDLVDLNTIMNCAVRYQYIESNPVKLIRMPKVSRAATKLRMSDEEITRLKAALEEWKAKGELHNTGFYKFSAGRGFQGNPYPLWFYVLVRLMLNTGLRPNEAVSLQWGDIDFTEKELTVRKEIAKNGNERTIPLLDVIGQELLQWYREAHGGGIGEDGEDLQFTEEPDPSEKIFPVSGFRKPWLRLKELAKMDDKFVASLLRHHFASTLILRNTPLSTVMKWLDHQDMATTQKYVTALEEDLKKVTTQIQEI